MKIEMPRKVILKGHGFSRAADSDRGFGLLQAAEKGPISG
jgi:hypothetical protein